MNDTVLKIEGLSKNYGKIQALSSLSLEVKSGMVYGILGPNGSGKTTTLGILLGVLNQTSGSFSWFGNGIKDENRKRIGALLETPNFYPYLDAIQNLKIVGKIKGVKNIDERIDIVLNQVNLLERKKSEFRTYSLGMKQRLAIASALLSNPEVLVLDEPTNGLDPEGIAEIRSLIIDIAKEGKTIIVASHQLDEIEKICTDVLILKYGKTLKAAPINEISENKRQVALAADNLNQLKQVLTSLNGLHIMKETQSSLLLEVSGELTTASINKACFEQGVVLTQLNEVQKSLEDQFLEIVK